MVRNIGLPFSFNQSLKCLTFEMKRYSNKAFKASLWKAFSLTLTPHLSWGSGPASAFPHAAVVVDISDAFAKKAHRACNVCRWVDKTHYFQLQKSLTTLPGHRNKDSVHVRILLGSQRQAKEAFILFFLSFPIFPVDGHAIFPLSFKGQLKYLKYFLGHQSKEFFSLCPLRCVTARLVILHSLNTTWNSSVSKILPSFSHSHSIFHRELFTCWLGTVGWHFSTCWP